jgi:preprotein translocase subunit SecG
MFGGGIDSGVQSSGSGERNLTRITWGVGVVWGLVVIMLGLIARFAI